jgi:hypothetical protein
MVKHVVLFKCKVKTDMSKIRDLLLTMKGKIEVIKDIDVGLNFIDREINFDVSLIVQLDKPKDMNVYLEHPYHLEVSKQLDVLCERRCAVDYIPM